MQDHEKVLQEALENVKEKPIQVEKKENEPTIVKNQVNPQTIPGQFSLQVLLLTGKVVTLSVNKSEYVESIKNKLSRNVESCYISCYDLFLDTIPLKDYEMISNYPLESNSMITMKERKYDRFQSKIHIKRVKELIFNDVDDLIVDRPILVTEGPRKEEFIFYPSFHSLFRTVDERFLEDKELTNLSEGDFLTKSYGDYQMLKKPFSSLSFLKSEEFKGKGRNLDIMKLFNNSSSSLAWDFIRQCEENGDFLFRPCLQSIEFSKWNPVKNRRKLFGDFFYLAVKTLEKNEFQITANAEGFFVNKSTSERFDYKSVDGRVFPNFVALLFALSPAFKEGFTRILYERCIRPVMLKAPMKKHFPNWFMNNRRLKHEFQTDFMSKLDHYLTPETNPSRNWNEEFQIILDTFNKAQDEGQSVFGEQHFSKLYREMMEECRNVSMKIVDNEIPPLGTSTPKKTDQIYVHNNVNYTFHEEPQKENDFENFIGVSEEVKKRDEAEYAKLTPADSTDNSVSSLNELHALQYFHKNTDLGVDLRTFSQTSIGYRGFRVLCQTYPSGLFDGLITPERIKNLFCFGYVNNSMGENGGKGDVFLYDEEVHKMLKELLEEKFHLKPSICKVLSEEGDFKERELICSKDVKVLKGKDGRLYIFDLARLTPRDLNFIENENATIRSEMVEAYYRSIDEMNQKNEKKLNKMKASGVEESKIPEELKKKIEYPKWNLEVMNPNEKENKEKNPLDFYPKEDVEAIQKLCSFVRSEIPKFLRDAYNQKHSVFDGHSLTESLHKAGLNIRYIGELFELIVLKKDGKPGFLKRVCLLEMFARSCKIEFNRILRCCEDEKLGEMTLKFVNCLFGFEEEKEEKELFYTNEIKKTVDFNAKGLHRVLNNRMKRKFKISDEVLKGEHLKPLKFYLTESEDLNQHGFGLAFFRRFCQLVGLQMMTKSNLFFAKRFVMNDFHGFVPIVPKVSYDGNLGIGRKLMDQAKLLLKKKQYQEAFLKAREAERIIPVLKGTENALFGECHVLLGDIFFKTTRFNQALIMYNRAAHIFHKLFGQDDYHLIEVFAKCGEVCTLVHSFGSAVKHFVKALVISKICLGHLYHPQCIDILRLLGTSIGVSNEMTKNSITVRLFEETNALIVTIFKQAVEMAKTTFVDAQQADFLKKISDNLIQRKEFMEAYDIEKFRLNILSNNEKLKKGKEKEIEEGKRFLQKCIKLAVERKKALNKKREEEEKREKEKREKLEQKEKRKKKEEKNKNKNKNKKKNKKNQKKKKKN